MKADRRIRVLLRSPNVRDRALMRTNRAETTALFFALDISRGEKKALQRYDPFISRQHPGRGWHTIAEKSA